MYNLKPTCYPFITAATLRLLFYQRHILTLCALHLTHLHNLRHILYFIPITESERKLLLFLFHKKRTGSSLKKKNWMKESSSGERLNYELFLIYFSYRIFHLLYIFKICSGMSYGLLNGIGFIIQRLLRKGWRSFSLFPPLKIKLRDLSGKNVINLLYKFLAGGMKKFFSLFKREQFYCDFSTLTL